MRSLPSRFPGGVPRLLPFPFAARGLAPSCPNFLANYLDTSCTALSRIPTGVTCPIHSTSTLCPCLLPNHLTLYVVSGVVSSPGRRLLCQCAVCETILPMSHLGQRHPTGTLQRCSVSSLTLCATTFVRCHHKLRRPRFPPLVNPSTRSPSPRQPVPLLLALSPALIVVSTRLLPCLLRVLRSRSTRAIRIAATSVLSPNALPSTPGPLCPNLVSLRKHSRLSSHAVTLSPSSANIFPALSNIPPRNSHFPLGVCRTSPSLQNQHSICGHAHPSHDLSFPASIRSQFSELLWISSTASRTR